MEKQTHRHKQDDDEILGIAAESQHRSAPTLTPTAEKKEAKEGKIEHPAMLWKNSSNKLGVDSEKPKK